MRSAASFQLDNVSQDSITMGGIILLKRRKRHLLYLTVPGLLMIGFFVLIPLMNSVRLAFFTWNGYSQNMKFVGMKNFISLLSDKRLGRTTVNTLIYGIGSCVLQNILGLAAALLVNRRFRGRGVMRAVIYMPVMISAFIMGKVMSYLFSFDNGVANDILAIFGRGPVNWLGNSWIGILHIVILYRGGRYRRCRSDSAVFPCEAAAADSVHHNRNRYEPDKWSENL